MLSPPPPKSRYRPRAGPGPTLISALGSLSSRPTAWHGSHPVARGLLPAIRTPSAGLHLVRGSWWPTAIGFRRLFLISVPIKGIQNQRSQRASDSALNSSSSSLSAPGASNDTDEEQPIPSPIRPPRAAAEPCRFINAGPPGFDSAATGQPWPTWGRVFWTYRLSRGHDDGCLGLSSRSFLHLRVWEGLDSEGSSRVI